MNHVAAAADPPPPSEATCWQHWPSEGLAGVDEVGRGALFGPVFAAAVVLDPLAHGPLQAAGLTDSKKLTARRRQALVPLIRASALAWGIGQASAEALLRAVRGAERELITDVGLFDVYEGEHVGAGKQSLAISVTLQSKDATLTEEQIEGVAKKIVAAVEKACGGQLRA